MRRVAALIVIGAWAVMTVPAAFAQGSGRVVENETRSERPYAGKKYRFNPGGYRYYGEDDDYSSNYDVFVNRFGSYGKTPDYDNRTFWERVQSDPRGSTVGASGL